MEIRRARVSVSSRSTKPGREIYKDLEAYAEHTPGFLDNFTHSFQVPVLNDELAVSTVRQTVSGSSVII